MQSRIDIHCHTRGSNMRLRDALPTPEQLIDRALEIGLAGVSISDHEFLGMHIRANKYAEKIKEKNPLFKVILGNEIYLVDERDADKHWHFLLTAKDKIGHKQLRILSSRAWLNVYTLRGMERVDTLKSDIEEVIGKNPGHIIGSTACLGSELGNRILNLTMAEKIGDTKTANEEHEGIVNFILWCKKIFKDDFYIEVQPGVSKDQITVNRRLVSIAHCFNLKMIPTSDAHYLKKEDRYIHKAFLNSEEKEREVDAFYQDTYLHTNEEMIEKFKLSDYDEIFVDEMFKNTMEIYDKIENYTLHHSQQIPTIELPNYPKEKVLIEGYPTLSSMYESEDKIDRYWIHECIDKLKELNKYNKKYLDELEEEANIKYLIGKKLNTNMFSYPITLAHYINLIWECGSTVGVGRGSACSALNHYLLGITSLDPLEWNFPFFRYMNRDTEELGDIDIDVCSTKIAKILKEIKKERGQRFLPSIDELSKENLGAVYVCTYGTETTKSAILTSCRGYRSEDYPEGIDVDIAQYISSLIPSERGFVWSLHDAYYGNPEKGRKPVTLFKQEVDSYPGLYDIMCGIEGLISRRGRHASGVLFLDEDPYEYNCFMKSPSGEVTTQYDLHDAEWAGSTKFDLLVTEIQDKIVETIKFLQEYGEIESSLTLRQAYDKYLLTKMPLDDKDTWKTIQGAESLDLFQLDSPIGRQGAKKVKPSNMYELSATNGVIRLMTQEKGAETPLEKYVRFKNNPNEWQKEMDLYHLTIGEQKTIRKYLTETSGIGISQEQLMRVLMDKDICNFSLKEANVARRIVSKKKMNQIPALKEQIYSKAKDENIAKYVWDVVVSTQLGYAFSDIHSMSYSYIGYQSAYLPTHWNPLYWNTACLIVNSGMVETDTEGKEKQTDYAKNAKALCKMTSNNIKVSLVDINKSDLIFKPNIENGEILFGMKALTRMNQTIAEQIIAGRPYVSMRDFLVRCPLNKSVMIPLIKAGAFDKLMESWAKELNVEPRILAMAYYLSLNCSAKKKITLQNFGGLIQSGVIPESLYSIARIYNFNKYLKKNKSNSYYILDDLSFAFYKQKYDLNNLSLVNQKFCILQTTWDKIYSQEMDIAREWLKENQTQVLKDYNFALFKDSWNKYAQGSISAWEMEVLCFYHHPHELQNISVTKYGLSDFNKLPENPEVEKVFKRGNAVIPIYKTYKIIGTVISKDDTRSTISILTTTGVVNVKFTKEYYAMYSRQISEKQEDGKKKVMEKGWFKRGTMIMCTGYRREDTFVCKSYKHTATHQLYKITRIFNNGTEMELEHERYGEEEI